MESLSPEAILSNRRLLTALLSYQARIEISRQINFVSENDMYITTKWLWRWSIDKHHNPSTGAMILPEKDTYRKCQNLADLLGSDAMFMQWYSRTIPRIEAEFTKFVSTHKHKPTDRQKELYPILLDDKEIAIKQSWVDSKELIKTPHKATPISITSEDIIGIIQAYSGEIANAFHRYRSVR